MVSPGFGHQPAPYLGRVDCGHMVYGNSPERTPDRKTDAKGLFNLGQVFLLGLTVIFAFLLLATLHAGLLSQPNMYVMGNGSYSHNDCPYIWNSFPEILCRHSYVLSVRIL